MKYTFHWHQAFQALPDMLGGALVTIEIALRQEYGLISYLNLFTHLQTRTGRAQELYNKWVGGNMPDLTVKGIYR